MVAVEGGEERVEKKEMNVYRVEISNWNWTS